jgi:hypothetical protein
MKRGMDLATAPIPTTDQSSLLKIDSTPTVRIFGPVVPKNAASGQDSRNAVTNSAASWSPDDSPVTIIIWSSVINLLIEKSVKAVVDNLFPCLILQPLTGVLASILVIWSSKACIQRSPFLAEQGGSL